jgi:hypothetical protein
MIKAVKKLKILSHTVRELQIPAATRFIGRQSDTIGFPEAMTVFEI